MEKMRNTVRVMDNGTAREVQALEDQGITGFEALKHLIQGQNQYDAYSSGDIDKGLLAMGQAAVFADKVAPLAEIYDSLLSDAQQALQGLDRLRLAQA
jgi:nitronate monooxygenase